MNICNYCIHEQTCTNKPLATTKCKDFEDKPKMTNGDKIRQIIDDDFICQMSNEELADRCTHAMCDYCPVKSTNCGRGHGNPKYCREAWLNYLYALYTPTVFDQITQSPETLAEKLVFWMSWHKADGAVEWYAVSTVAEGKWSTKAEAIDATIEKLKEVATVSEMEIVQRSKNGNCSEFPNN